MLQEENTKIDLFGDFHTLQVKNLSLFAAEKKKPHIKSRKVYQYQTHKGLVFSHYKKKNKCVCSSVPQNIATFSIPKIAKYVTFHQTIAV